MVDFEKIQKKWQTKWEDANLFKVSEISKKPKYFLLEMFPYPSSSSLHMGHARNYIIGDSYTRFKRMNGFNVLYPMGYDSFGLPAENAAIKARSHPKPFTEDAIKRFVRQQKELGLSYDWDRMIASHTPQYYRWDQWIFLQLYKKGLAYKKISAVNFCPKCNTVLANEQVINGKCWRHDETDVEIKELNQWFFKITDYADELLRDVDKLQWSEDVKQMQRNWISRKEGYNQFYKVKDMDITLSTFTTHHHTSFAEIFIVIAPEHPLAKEFVKGTEYEKGTHEFIKNVQKKKMSGKFTPESAKDGYFTGRYAKDPCTKEYIPIYIADFALMDFGTGIVKASCHDQRDFDFAKTHDIKLVEVLFPNKLIEKGKGKYDVIHPGLDDVKMRDWSYDGPYHEKNIGTVKVDIKGDTAEIVVEIDKDAPWAAMQESAVLRQLTYMLFSEDKCKRITMPNMKECSMEMNDFVEIGFIPDDNGIFILNKGKEDVPLSYDGQGYMFRSDQFSGLSVPEAKKKMGAWMFKNGYAEKAVTYGIRDWLISRQRFWGCPIPIIYCDKCGEVPVPEKDLPVLLPDDIRFKGAENPLKNYKPFLEVKCPKCKGNAKRETDTMDTFVDSSWYFLRYCDAKNDKQLFNPKKANYWMPIDQYIGGKEHACGHLIYFRFFTKFLRDIGLLKFDEPAIRLFNQGMLHKGGVVMSKSKGNVVIPEEVSKKYGIDTARLFLMFVSSPGKDMEWSDEGVEGSYRFINKFYHLISEKRITDKISNKEASKLNKTIKEVTEHFDRFEFNLAIIKIMQLTHYLYEQDSISKESASALIRMLSPFVPHVCEELWELIENKPFVSTAKWPGYDKNKIDESADAADAMVDRTKTDITNLMKLLKVRKPKKIKLITAFKWKYKLVKLLKKEMEKTRDIKILIQRCMKDSELQAKDIAKLVPALVKDPKKVPATVLSQDKEFEELNGVKEKLKSLFGAEIEVEKAEASKEQKANNALPGKPAIILQNH